MTVFRFASPEWLLLLAVVPVVIYRYVRDRDRRQGHLRFSDLRLFQRLDVRLATPWRHVLIVLRVGAIVCLILAMARPQAGREIREYSATGIDTMLTLDVSSSMQLKDLAGGKKTRLQVAKEVISDFISGRTGDRIGMVVFAGESFTQCPLTLDYQVLQEFLTGIQIADQAWDGTAIGMALVNACNRLRDSKGRSKVIILLTDGVNNAGEIDPLTAADAAAALGIKVYAVGVGTHGTIRRPVQGIFGTRYQTIRVEIDEKLLEDVAARTGGRYFRADSAEKLKEIYREIGQLEKTDVTTKVHVDYADRFPYLLWPGLLMFLLELVLANTRFRRIP